MLLLQIQREKHIKSKVTHMAINISNLPTNSHLHEEIRTLAAKQSQHLPIWIQKSFKHHTTNTKSHYKFRKN